MPMLLNMEPPMCQSHTNTHTHTHTHTHTLIKTKDNKRK